VIGKCRSSVEETLYTLACRHPMTWMKLQSRAAGLFRILTAQECDAQSVRTLFAGSIASPVADDYQTRPFISDSRTYITCSNALIQRP
jgi:hypothetical protein